MAVERAVTPAVWPQGQEPTLFALLHFPGVGPHLLALLGAEGKAPLRATCSSAKAAVDPTITKVSLKDNLLYVCKYERVIEKPSLPALVHVNWNIKHLSLADYTAKMRLRNTSKFVTAYAFMSVHVDKCKIFQCLYGASWWKTLEVLEIKGIACSQLAGLDMACLKTLRLWVSASGSITDFKTLLTAPWWKELKYIKVQCFSKFAKGLPEARDLDADLQQKLCCLTFGSNVPPADLAIITQASWFTHLKEVHINMMQNKLEEVHQNLELLGETGFVGLKMVGFNFGVLPAECIDVSAIKMAPWFGGLKSCLVMIENTCTNEE